VGWEETGAGNEVLRGEGFFVSYRGSMHEPTGMLGALNALGGVFGLETKSEETALCRPNETAKYLVLNGDFREEYEAAVPKGLAACLAVYEKHKAECRSDWSMDEFAKEASNED